MSALVELRLENCATFISETLGFKSGFVALTGETGSGKTVAMTALRLALGGKLENPLVRHGQSTARMTAVFRAIDGAETEFLSSHGVSADELLTLTREISAEGKSTCRINGALVSLRVLRELGDILADVSKQGDVRRISSSRYQRHLLDTAAGNVLLELKAKVGQLFRQREELVRQLDEAQKLASATAVEIEKANLVVAELEPLHLEEVDLEALRQDRDRLRASNAILTTGKAIAHAVGDEHSVRDRLVAASDNAAALRHLDPQLAALLDEADAVVAALDDLALSAHRFTDSVVADEARLAECEAALSEIEKIRRRFGSLEAAGQELQRARQLLQLSSADAEIKALEGRVDGVESQLATAAAELSQKRRAAARELETVVTAALRQMELPRAQFRISLQSKPDDGGIGVGGTRVRCSADGIDEVTFLFAANRAAETLPLELAASGGEQSRLLLALAASVNDADTALLVLDEIDTGIGGETAARVGDLLAAIGIRRQVLVITHRPEIAARAGSHLLVTKADDRQSGAVSRVSVVEGEARTEEIARLMSGRPTAAAKARAVELLGEAHSGRPRRLGKTTKPQ